MNPVVHCGAFSLRERERAAAAADRRAMAAAAARSKIGAHEAARRAKAEAEARAAAEWDASMKEELDARREAEARRVPSRPVVCHAAGDTNCRLVFFGGRGLAPDTPGIAPDGPTGTPGPSAHRGAARARDYVLPRAPVYSLGRGARVNEHQAVEGVEVDGDGGGAGPNAPAVAACGAQADSTRRSAAAFSWGKLPRFTAGERAGADSPGVATYSGAARRDTALSQCAAPPEFSIGKAGGGGGAGATPLADAANATPGPAVFDLRPRPATTAAWPPSFSFGGCRLPKDPAARRKAQRRRNRSKEAHAAAAMQGGYCGPGPAQLQVGGAREAPMRPRANGGGGGGGGGGGAAAALVTLVRSPSLRPRPPMPAIRGAGAFAPRGRRQWKRYTRRFGGSAAPTPGPGAYDHAASAAIAAAPDEYALVALCGTLGSALRGEVARGELKAFEDRSRSSGLAP